MQPASPGLLPHSGSQKPDFRQLRSRASHLAARPGSRRSSIQVLRIARARASLSVSLVLFLVPSVVGHPRLMVGHRCARQEPAVDLVVIDATGPTLTGDDAAPHESADGAAGALRYLGVLCELTTDGKQRPARSAKLTRHCIVQRRCGLSGRYRSKAVGTKASMGPPGCSAPARKRLILGALCQCTPKGLAKHWRFGEARRRQTTILPRLHRICRPAFRGGFCFSGFWCRGLAQMEPCAQRIPRAA